MSKQNKQPLLQRPAVVGVLASLLSIVIGLVLGFVLLLLDDRFYDTFAYGVYALLLLLLFATIFNPHEIKGSRSWLVLGPIHIQPAEFAKFATALAVAKFMSTYGFDIGKWKHFASAMANGVIWQYCSLSWHRRRLAPHSSTCRSSSCSTARECREASFSRVSP